MSQCPKCKRENCSCDDLDCNLCPEQIPTRRFASANSPLPPRSLDELQECIEAANDLLRSLGNRRDPNNQRQLQLELLALQDICVKAEINCGRQKKREKIGILVTAGRDFIEINSSEDGDLVFVLFNRLITIDRDKSFKTNIHPEQDLIDADKCTKRELSLNFGEFVAKRPELINLFFGIPLHLYLLKFIGEEVKVKTDDETIMNTTLSNVEEGRIEVKGLDGTIGINMDEICFIEIIGFC